MSQDFHNPFDPKDPSRPPEDDGPGLLGQVTPLGWCLMVQAALEFFAGVVFLVICGLAIYAARNMPEEIGNANFERESEAIVVLTYGSIGVCTIVASLFRLFSTFRLMRYEGRKMGFVSLGIGALTSFTVCCSVTSIGLLVWGSVVLVNDPVRRAFELRAAGNSKEKIDAMLGLTYPH